MQIELMYAKLHRATVTDANLNYVGSITIDDINNGERLSTYVIKGQRGKRDFCLNGAAARKVAVGDKIIVIAYASFDITEAAEHKPYIVQLDDDNNVRQ